MNAAIIQNSMAVDLLDKNPVLRNPNGKRKFLAGEANVIEQYSETLIKEKRTLDEYKQKKDAIEKQAEVMLDSMEDMHMKYEQSKTDLDQLARAKESEIEETGRQLAVAKKNVSDEKSHTPSSWKAYLVDVAFVLLIEGVTLIANWTILRANYSVNDIIHRSMMVVAIGVFTLVHRWLYSGGEGVNFSKFGMGFTKVLALCSMVDLILMSVFFPPTTHAVSFSLSQATAASSTSSHHHPLLQLMIDNPGIIELILGAAVLTIAVILKSTASRPAKVQSQDSASAILLAHLSDKQTRQEAELSSLQNRISKLTTDYNTDVDEIKDKLDELEKQLKNAEDKIEESRRFLQKTVQTIIQEVSMYHKLFMEEFANYHNKPLKLEELVPQDLEAYFDMKLN